MVVPATLADEIACARSLDFCIALALMGSTGPVERALRGTSIATGGQEREKHQKETEWEAHEILTWRSWKIFKGSLANMASVAIGDYHPEALAGRRKEE